MVMFQVSSVFSSGAVALGGSRGLSGRGPWVLADVMQSLQVAGHPLIVGCSVGADEVVLRYGAGKGPLQVLAVSANDGRGSWGRTALRSVNRAGALGASGPGLALFHI